MEITYLLILIPLALALALVWAAIAKRSQQFSFDLEEEMTADTSNSWMLKSPPPAGATDRTASVVETLASLPTARAVETLAPLPSVPAVETPARPRSHRTTMHGTPTPRRRQRNNHATQTVYSRPGVTDSPDCDYAPRIGRVA